MATPAVAVMQRCQVLQRCLAGSRHGDGGLPLSTDLEPRIRVIFTCRECQRAAGHCKNAITTANLAFTEDNFIQTASLKKQRAFSSTSPPLMPARCSQGHSNGQQRNNP